MEGDCNAYALISVNAPIMRMVYGMFCHPMLQIFKIMNAMRLDKNLCTSGIITFNELETSHTVSYIVSRNDYYSVV